jgi:hypothetical protein
MLATKNSGSDTQIRMTVTPQDVCVPTVMSSLYLTPSTSPLFESDCQELRLSAISHVSALAPCLNQFPSVSGCTCCTPSLRNIFPFLQRSRCFIVVAAYVYSRIEPHLSWRQQQIFVIFFDSRQLRTLQLYNRPRPLPYRILALVSSLCSADIASPESRTSALLRPFATFLPHKYQQRCRSVQQEQTHANVSG